jgi:5-methylcytosine-specific restriction protein A
MTEAAMEFIPGRLYNRRNLHAQFGGQRYGGISTPKGYPFIFLFTGESGKAYGYRDGFQPDGTFWYTGEGQVGNQDFAAGNLATRDHELHRETLHLFEAQPREGWVQYLGEATYIQHHEEVAPDKNGDPRKVIVFELALDSRTAGESWKPEPPADSKEDALWDLSMEDLWNLATKARQGKSSTERKKIEAKRSNAVKVYVLRRASGTCEGCGSLAPFKTLKGRPYLEPHHLRRRADHGPDHPRWVAALCPNCHREVHYGEDGPKLNEQLAVTLGKLERA